MAGPEPLPVLRLHDLRHFHATTLLRTGWAVHIVSRRIGHKNVEMTWNTYTDVIPEDEAASAMLY